MFGKLRGDIACILERDPAARTTWEILTCYPGLHAIWIHKLARWFWLRKLRWLGGFTSHIGRFLTGIEVHPVAKIGSAAFTYSGLGCLLRARAGIFVCWPLYSGCR